VSDAAAHGADGHAEVNYMAKFYWLVALTAIEVGVAIAIPGGWKLLLLTLLSLWKAGIVLNHFMHLKSEGIALKLAMLFPLVLVFILVSLFLLDSHVLGYSGI
jgi:cytochrome c oxidase subunit IV